MLHTAYTLTCHIVAKAKHEDALAATLAALVAPTRSESGCLLFTLHHCKDNPAEFLLYGVWVDEAAFKAHRQTQHAQQWLAQQDTLVAEQTIKYWQAVKSRELCSA